MVLYRSSVGEWEVQVVDIFEKEFVGFADVRPGAFVGPYVVIFVWQLFGARQPTMGTKAIRSARKLDGSTSYSS